MERTISIPPRISAHSYYPAQKAHDDILSQSLHMRHSAPRILDQDRCWPCNFVCLSTMIEFRNPGSLNQNDSGFFCAFRRMLSTSEFHSLYRLFWSLLLPGKYFGGGFLAHWGESERHNLGTVLEPFILPDNVLYDELPRRERYSSVIAWAWCFFFGPY